MKLFFTKISILFGVLEKCWFYLAGDTVFVIFLKMRLKGCEIVTRVNCGKAAD
jgi:hypothetical protein